MTIDQTIEAAATKFGVTPLMIRSPRKGGAITEARKWIVAQHPEKSCWTLARALGMTSHGQIIRYRKSFVSHTNANCPTP